MTAAIARPRGARTREATDRKIMRAAMQIALQRGIAAITIEEVARRSGVAKTTIYRRYANTNDLLRGLRNLGVPDDAELEVMEPTRGNLERLLQGVVERFRAGIGVKTVGMVLASDDEFFHHVVDAVVRPEERRCMVFIQHGIDAGVFRSDADGRFLFGTAIGSMVACEALRGAVDDDWPARMAELIWPAIAA
ncbi:TetR/AcrR family transcriptional regulator [Bifidobacterium vespertilionis]|uniref:TetR/AcrR family transcriptional regulator n=1 Tax=Bifidobacterium vespertilionis TaxID=2562524 RepID=A0A5J5DWE8_9BIFI|nr:TetR/AcrR family transcriptional regulator [Bifidobacterium vespertilionis]KAA8820992.1 TetR/AcrR family transcriptional regulator [Bifidobacterium vespertilionis]